MDYSAKARVRGPNGEIELSVEHTVKQLSQNETSKTLLDKAIEAYLNLEENK